MYRGIICECAVCCKKMPTHHGHVLLSVVAASTKNVATLYKEIYGYISFVLELTHVCVVCDAYMVQFLRELLLPRTSSRIACWRFCASEWCQK